MKQPKTPRMQQPGHYRRPMVNLPGMSNMNMPGRGRVGKLIPSMKKMGVPKPKGR